jgi:CDP-diacylglycerol pyrophosphatase
MLAVVGLAACATTDALPPPPEHPNGQALWKIVSEHCMSDQARHGDPAPCPQVSLTDGPRRGYVVLKDREGPTQYLLMPTDKITGIEDAKLLEPDRPNYFAQAWAARGLVEAKLGKPVPRDEMSVAVNSPYGRSQDQLHLHIDCLDLAVRDALRADAARIGPRWSRRAFTLAGQPYRIERVDGETLAVDPFRRLAQDMPVPASQMAAWTLVLVGETAADGQAGFYLIAGRIDPKTGNRASGEALQDHACAGQRAARVSAR